MLDFDFEQSCPSLPMIKTLSLALSSVLDFFIAMSPTQCICPQRFSVFFVNNIVIERKLHWKLEQNATFNTRNCCECITWGGCSIQAAGASRSCVTMQYNLCHHLRDFYFGEALCLCGRWSHVAGFFSSLSLILRPFCSLSLTSFDLWQIC